ncbi:VCBS repeat-containing protein [Microbacterium sp. SSW1-49]|uniref:VCBS repeat-containing protein n=1 Tax=Microbacterium croceum TaxID=2851645 RepID=A0ABT0FE22_9MICO|nr:VCBS repeat-containing protein [Microbacterium croceum]MCK2036310.1 VCBS repeat-containing protein [Microbacterium croceum]
MSRRAPRSRNTLKGPQLFTCFLAAFAVVLSTVIPAGAATASVSSTAVSAARAASDPVSTGLAKTTLAGFTPGNIISNAVFTNKNTMTEAQIQTFFNSKVAKCQSGYVCLKDFKITSVTRPADAYCSGYTGAANESAARIIYRVAQSCNINPRVLIVMLQKEQGLVTHTWPSAWRYNIALGQGCPDTAPCDPNYVGFFHQIYGAARQMQIYMEGKWFQWYAPGNTWNILYNPNASCGSAPVYVANAATAALYYYTPYQPNAAALRAGYGEGNSCSAYGNRNFYNYFTDWFGSTQSQQPAVTPPVLKSVNTTNYIVGVDESGSVWGYPYTKTTWGARVQLASGLTNTTNIINVGDFDGDGNRDFIALDKDSRASLVRSDGGTKLSAPEALPGDWSGVVAAYAAGDFDGDGYPDLFTTNAQGDLFLRSGTGFGGYRAPMKVGSGWHKMSQVSGGIDINGDGRPDVVARDAAGNLYLYPGNGRGGWGTRVLMGHGWSNMTSIFSPGDFDGDGRPDLLAHAADGKLVLYRGLASGKVTSAGIIGSGWHTLVGKGSAAGAISGPRTFPGGMGNVDGVPGNDVVAVTTTGEAYIYGGSGTGKFGARSNLATGWNANDKVISLGDFNGDGYPDLGRIDAAGAFQFYAGKAGGGFAAPQQIGHGWGGFTRAIGGLDYDGDRFTDVAVLTDDGRMLLYRGNGRGGWSPGGGTQISHGWTIADEVFYAGDFDGDGRGDIIARLTDGTLRQYPLTGRGAFGAATQIGHGWDVFSTVFSPGDFTSDGKSDIVAVDTDGVMYLYAGTGTGKMQARVKIGTGWKMMSVIG